MKWLDHPGEGGGKRRGCDTFCWSDWVAESIEWGPGAPTCPVHHVRVPHCMFQKVDQAVPHV